MPCPTSKKFGQSSKTGLSGITVVFDESVDIYFALQLVFERLQAAKELIPEGVGTPEMGPNSSGHSRPGLSVSATCRGFGL